MHNLVNVETRQLRTLTANLNLNCSVGGLWLETQLSSAVISLDKKGHIRCERGSFSSKIIKALQHFTFYTMNIF